jgi:transposase-like protein
MNEDIFFNVIQDWNKRKIDPEVKSAFIMDYLKKENISIRELARRLGMNYGTLQDWVSMRQRNKYREITSIFTLANRLIYLLSKKVVNEKEKKELLILKTEIEKVII